MPARVDSLIRLGQECDEMLLLLGVMPVFVALLTVALLLYAEHQELRSNYIYSPRNRMAAGNARRMRSTL
jgi:hypothetical protein